MMPRALKSFCLEFVRRRWRERVFMVTSRFGNNCGVYVVYFRSEEKAKEWAAITQNCEIRELTVRENRLRSIRFEDEVRHVISP